MAIVAVFVQASLGAPALMPAGYGRSRAVVYRSSAANVLSVTGGRGMLVQDVRMSRVRRARRRGGNATPRGGHGLLDGEASLAAWARLFSTGAPSAPAANGVFDVRTSVGAFRAVQIVGTAEDADVGCAAVATAGARLDVVVFEPRARAALDAIITAKAAAQAVSLEDLASGRTRHIWRRTGGRRRRVAALRSCGLVRRLVMFAWGAFGASPEATFHESLDEQVEGAAHDGGQISARERMTHEISSELELVLQSGVGGKLDPEAPLSEGLDQPAGGRVSRCRAGHCWTVDMGDGSGVW